MISYLATILAPALMASTASVNVQLIQISASDPNTQCSGLVIVTGQAELCRCTPILDPGNPIQDYQPGYTVAVDISGKAGITCSVWNNPDCSDGPQWSSVPTGCNSLPEGVIAGAIMCSASQCD